MSSRVIQAVRLVRCLKSSSSLLLSSALSKEATRRSCNRLVALDSTTRNSFCTASSEPSDPVKDSKICIESTAFTESVSNLSKSLGLSQHSEWLKQALVHRSYLTTHSATLKQEHKHNDQLALLGLQTTKRYLTELLLQHFPHLSSQELWDIQNGILETQVLSVVENLQLSQHIAYDCAVNTNEAVVQSLMAIVAVLYIHEDKGVNKTRQFIYDHFISNLDENQMQEMIKLQHPKYILRHLSKQNRNEPLRLRFLRKKVSKDTSTGYKVGVFKEEQCLAVGTGSSVALAEKRACQKALYKVYPDEIKQFNFSYESQDYESEDKIDLGLVTSRQRIITIEKEDEGFGFTIKGGERKRIKNQDWLLYNYFSPVFISSFRPDGLAERLGTLRLGDVILAVNDKSLFGVDHATAVKILKEASGTVTLTVQHSKEVLLADRVETEYKKMKQRKRLAELSSEVWAEWHQAQADKYPEKYADVLKHKENVA